ncbi:MAG: alpha/beta hydrolase [Pseudomonadales bacterium]|nr:alpha/beta hydrolase [Pseudomonadales bacterium]
MQKLFLAIISVFLLLLAAWIILPLSYNEEYQSIDAQARLSAPGQFANLSKGFTHYELAGPETAQTVVLIHGFSVPQYIWEPTFQSLTSAGYRVLRYDLYGRGYSDRPELKYNGSLFDSQLSELLKNLNLTLPADIIGLSMGGAIATDFTAKHPENVRKLVLIDPSHRAKDKHSMVEKPVIGKFIMDVFLAPGMAESQTTDFFKPERFPDWAQKYRNQMTYKGFKFAIRSTLKNYAHEDHWAAYKQVGALNKPVLLIWGRGDKTIPFSASPAVQDVLKADLLAIDQAGHLPHYEQPEIVNPILLEFLANDS